jgi:hypothetical protein
MVQTTTNLANPLAKHFRQPALYLKLPSNGEFWPEGSIDMPIINELPILPMTTKDEITLKTPDALLNGQGVVDVIQSCCPNIKDAWQTPGIDVDSIIIAIRIASYGEQMDFNSTCPHCKEESSYGVDLGKVLAGIEMPDYLQKLQSENLKIKLKPQPYHIVNKNNMIAFEEQQLLRTISQIENDTDALKTVFDQQLAKLVELNITLLTGSTEYIETTSEVVSDTAFINEFYKNCDTKIVKLVRDKLQEFSDVGSLKPFSVKCHNCSEDFNVTVTFDFASFFANGS